MSSHHARILSCLIEFPHVFILYKLYTVMGWNERGKEVNWIIDRQNGYI